jgi:Na+-transporting NADH:ubiquinone oxidoreductase subunit NqrA
MEQLGIYEVAPEDFALCEFVDTSKLELQRIVVGDWIVAQERSEHRSQ